MGLFTNKQKENIIEKKNYDSFRENELVEVIYQRYAVNTNKELLNKSGFMNSIWDNTSFIRSVCKEDANLYQRYLEVRLENEEKKPKNIIVDNVSEELAAVLRQAYYYEENDTSHDISILKQPHSKLLLKILGYYNVIGVNDTVIRMINNLYSGEFKDSSMGLNYVQERSIKDGVVRDELINTDKHKEVTTAATEPITYEVDEKEFIEESKGQSTSNEETLPIAEEKESADTDEMMYMRLNDYEDTKYYLLMGLSAEENYYLLYNMQEANGDGSIQDPISYLDTCGACIESVDAQEVNEYHFEYTIEKNLLEKYI